MDKSKVGTMMQSAAKVPISELNECITCKLCKGYYIEATTIIECLHTFCRSCIVRYLESNKYCPICDVQVHKTKPLLNLRPDKTIQNLVYKLVPRLYQNESQRRKTFYENHPDGEPTAAEQAAESQYDYILAPEKSINLTLHYHGCGAAPRYLRCPSAVSVAHLKKLIRAKYGLTDHHRVDVFFNQDCLNPSFSLMDISYIYSWKRKDPLDLTYKIYECRAKRPKLDTADKSDNNANNSANNNNNNNWKEVQLRISETGEMSITGIGGDSSMLELLDATENFKNEIVINEGKNLENFPKPIQVDTDIGNGEVKIQANRTVSIDSHVKAPENAPSSNKQQEGAQNPAATSKKDLPGLKFIGKSSVGTCTTSTATNTNPSCVGTKIANSSAKMGNNASKTVNSSSKTGLESKRTLGKATHASEASKTPACPTKTSAKSSKSSSDTKQPKNTVSMPKSMELSASLNLNSELSVIPLSASTSCVSLSSCGGTTTVFSTISNSMCSTKMECGGCTDEKSRAVVINSKEGLADREKESVVNNVPKDSKNLKRKCEEEGKAPDVPAKLPKPTILNHSIGLMNLSNNHPLKKHSKMNRNGEHLLRSSEVGEKVPISTPTLTVNHVSVSQKPMDTTASKPIIINKNVSNLQINRPGTPKSGQRGGQGANVPLYTNNAMYNSVAGLGKLVERNGEKVEGAQGKPEVLNSTVNSVPKHTYHPVHQNQLYQTTHHTPIITPAQLLHHQNMNSLQAKSSPGSNSIANQENTEQKGCQGNVATSQSNLATSQGNVVTLHSNVATLQGIMATSPNVISQKRTDIAHESLPLSMQTTIISAATDHSIHANTLSSAPASIQNTPTSQAPPVTVTTPVGHAPASIKTKPSTPIGYKTLRDPPKSWNSQINSQIARVNQNVKAQQLANAAAAAAAAASQGGGVNAQGRFQGDLKSVRPAKFFKGRNMPRYLGCPASGVKPMYQVQASSDKEKSQEQQTVQIKVEKSEIKKHSIVKIDPKTLRPISEKAPETSNLSNISSNLLSASQGSQELRVNSTPGDLKINTSSVSIFNPLKLQSSPKSERKSPKSPHSPKVKGGPNGNNLSGATTITTTSSPSNALSPKQHRDKTNLTFTPPNPFVPNLASPTMSPNQFLYPAGGFPSYDPRVMAAYHSLWYTQRMAAAAAAGFVPPPMPHAFGMNIALNTGTTTMGQQQHNPGISPKHSTPPKTSPRGGTTTPTQITKTSSTPPNKRTKETASKNEKSLETALNKLSQNKAKELGESKQTKPQLGAGKKATGKESGGEINMPVVAQHNSPPKVLGVSKTVGLGNSLGDARQRISSPKPKSLGDSKKSELGNTNVSTQQNRGPTKNVERNISAMSALEKLSQNKAIEIVRERDGSNSPMGGAKPGVGGGRESSALTLTDETAKKPAPTERKDTTPEINAELLASRQELKKSSSIHHTIDGSKSASIPVPTPSELQTRLGQCSETLTNKFEQTPGAHDRLDKCEKEVERLEQDRSDQGENRLDQVLCSTETNRVALTEKKSAPPDASRSEADSNTNPRVASSDTTDKIETNSDKKQSIFDSSDIKCSSPRSSTEAAPVTVTDVSCDNVAAANSTGNVAGSVTSEVAVAVTPGGADAESRVTDAVADDTSGNGEDKSDSVAESDRGGGEK